MGYTVLYYSTRCTRKYRYRILPPPHGKGLSHTRCGSDRHCVSLAAATSASPAARTVLWDADAPGSGAPPSWQRGSRAAEERVTFHVPLVGANRGVEEMLSRVSDPLSPDYGNYLSPEELAQEFAAPADVQARVEAFFAQYDDVSCGSVGGASQTTGPAPRLSSASFTPKCTSMGTLVRPTP